MEVTYLSIHIGVNLLVHFNGDGLVSALLLPGPSLAPFASGIQLGLEKI